MASLMASLSAAWLVVQCWFLGPHGLETAKAVADSESTIGNDFPLATPATTRLPWLSFAAKPGAVLSSVLLR